MILNFEMQSYEMFSFWTNELIQAASKGLGSIPAMVVTLQGNSQYSISYGHLNEATLYVQSLNYGQIIKSIIFFFLLKNIHYG